MIATVPEWAGVIVMWLLCVGLVVWGLSARLREARAAREAAEQRRQEQAARDFNEHVRSLPVVVVEYSTMHEWVRSLREEWAGSQAAREAVDLDDEWRRLSERGAS